MKKGYLSQYFSGVAMKNIAAVEVSGGKSNQHEYNAVKAIVELIGTSQEKQKLVTQFMYINDTDPEPIIENGFLTFYDARKNNPNRSAEYRLYFTETFVSINVAEGDLLVIAKQQNEDFLVIIAEAKSTMAQQIMWLFGFSDLSYPAFSIRAELESEQDKIGFAARVILENIGIEIKEEEPSYLDVMLQRFDGVFPSTKVFSEYARGTLNDLSSVDEPDTVLMAWIEREDILFRTLEKYFIAERLKSGFHETEDFISYSLSIQNRRKSRAGAALENHLQKIFDEHNIAYSRNLVTEEKHKPDFIFPSIQKYHDLNYPQEKLTMLASKSTCKERWRQILDEALRISNKHLLTLQPSISEHQTNQMQTAQVQLIVPSSLHKTYNINQQAWLMNVSDFLTLLREKAREL